MSVFNLWRKGETKQIKRVNMELKTLRLEKHTQTYVCNCNKSQTYIRHQLRKYAHKFTQI